jgi:hypothetical protein
MPFAVTVTVPLSPACSDPVIATDPAATPVADLNCSVPEMVTLAVPGVAVWIPLGEKTAWRRPHCGIQCAMGVYAPCSGAISQHATSGPRREFLSRVFA